MIILQNSMDEYNKIIEQKDYCEQISSYFSQSQLLIQQYSNNKPVDLNEQLAFIKKWVLQDNQNALIITGEPETGTKTLLCSFLKQSKKQNPEWLHIVHFVSITPIYSNILYKIMIQLRNHFKIEQKVDLNDQKLRRYFKYWLQIVSDFLQKQYLGYHKNEIPKVIIILEGVDGCVDLKGNLVQHKLWLPSYIPSNIKLIITTKTDSHTIQNSLVLHHYMSQERRQKIIKKCCEKTHNINEKYKNQKLYSLILIQKMVQAKPQFVVLGPNIEEIIKSFISNVSDSSISEEEIKSLLYTLTLTRKGLKYKWVQRIINVNYQKWQIFCKYFDFFIVQSSNHYIICNPKAKNLIQIMIDPHKEKVRAYRSSIIRAIKNQSLHLRGLQQIVYQLLLTQNFSELKEVICRIQNFIMLYTPFSKELLCQCWVRLEILQQFDPVFEYNRAIQAYSSHYYPKEEDLYKIIFQISIFFKEYAEFQNAKTPKFRHPLINGQVGHLQEIGIYDELKLLEIIGKCKGYKLKPLQNMIEKGLSKLKIKDQSTSKKDKHKDILKQLKRNNKTELSKTSITRYEKQSSKAQKINKKQDSSQTERASGTQVSSPELQALQVFNVQELNVGIVANQQKFRQFFTQQMKQYLQNYFAPLKKNIYKDKQLAFESQQSDNQQDSCKNKEEKQFRVDVQKLKDTLILKKYKEYLQEDYHKNGEEVSYYYYKQWIWLQFPWICQTVKHIYSQMINQCLPGSIHFMSPNKEFSLIKQVLKITKTAKQTKTGIYTQKKIEILPIKNPQFRFQKMRKNEQKQTSYCQTKRSKLQSQPNKKYKFDLNRIQLQIVREKQQGIKLLERTNITKNLHKSQNSLLNSNMFVTQNEAKESRFLPTIKKSAFGSAEQYIKSEIQNKNQNSRDYAMMVRKFNELKHNNQMLIQKIEDMKRLNMQNVDKNQQETQKINRNIASLQERQANLQKNLKNQLQLSIKLQIILKICDLNKMYGSQTDYLSTYLDNLKYMIDVEDTKTKRIKQSINQTLQNGKLQIKMLKQKRRQLKQIKEQKLCLRNLTTDSSGPQAINLQFEQIQKQLNQMNKVIKTKSRKIKSKENQYFSEKDYRLLQQQIGIQYGDTNNDKKIQQFADKYQKLNLLRLKKMDLKTQCSALEKRLSQRKLNDKVLQGKDKNNIQIGGILVQKKKQLGQLKNRSQLLQNALQSLAIPQQ